MADSLVSIDKKCIFRETFENEQSVRKNGGIPTNITFSNGIATHTATSYNTYSNFTTKGTYSFRIRIKQTSLSTNQYLFSCYNSGVVGKVGWAYVALTTGIVNAHGGGTMYVNSILNGVVTAGNWCEVVISGTTITPSFLRLGNSTASGNNIIGDFDLVEVYLGTLSADEVKNLYENKRYREVSSHGEQLGPELNPDPYFQNDSLWTKDAGWSISNGIATGTQANYLSLTSPPDIVVASNLGRIYKIEVDIVEKAAGIARVYFTIPGYSNITTTVATTHVLYATSGNAGDYMGFLGVNGTFKISRYSVKEVLSNYTKPILDVCACNGVIKNKYSGDVYNELLSNGNFETDSVWTKGAGWSISNGSAVGNGVGTGYLGQSVLTSGKTYTVKLKANVTSGQFLVYIGTTWAGTVTTSGEYSFTKTAAGAVLNIGESAFNGSIEYVSCKEVIPSVVVTSTEVVKDNDVWAMKFNKSTSNKIDCGSYDGMVGDKTFVFWLKPKTWGTGNIGTILRNDKLIVMLRDTFSGIGFFSDGATQSNSSSGLFRNWKLYVVTRTSSGATTHYVDSVVIGVVASGTPVVGTANLTIGNNPTGTSAFDGLISSVRIYDGLMTKEEISSMYSSEKTKYGL